MKMTLHTVTSTGLRYLSLIQRSPRKLNKFLRLLSAPQVRECSSIVDSATVNILDSVDIQKYVNFMTMHNQLEGIEELTQLVKKKVNLEEELKKLEEMSSEGDKEFEKLIDSEKKEYLDSITEVKKEILYQIMPKGDDNDNRNVELKIVPGIGGEEAKVFSAELFNMYLSYIEFKNWEYSGSISDGIFISGVDVFGHLRYEAGVHRVQRVPGNDSLHRVHTSTCSVVILPQPRDNEIKISERDLVIERIKSSGPGGQNVNKRETCIRIKHVPTGVVIENQTSRYQFENLKEAINRLRGVLFNREQEKITKERRATVKEQVGTNDYSDKIRTYNFPQNRVTDHRINQSNQNLKRFLSGGKELESFIKQVREHSMRRKFVNSINNVLESVEYKNFDKQLAA